MKTISILTSLLICFFVGGVVANVGLEDSSLLTQSIIAGSLFAASIFTPVGVLTIVCAPNCITTIPMVIGSEACDLVERAGGIPRLTFLQCQYADTDPTFRADGGWTNVDNVRDAICGEILYVTGEVLGSKPAPSFTKRRFGSCSPEKTTSGTQTITFSDFNHDPTDLVEFDFWQAIVDNKRRLTLGWITCDDLWYQYTGDWDIEIGEQTEETKEGNAFFAGIITISEKDIIKPIKVTGLNAMLNSFATTQCDYYL